MNFRERDDMGANVIMVASGKGGTGKSTVAVLLGAELAARGRRVLLVELDSGLRSVDYIAGVYGKTVYDVEDVLNGRCEAGKAVVESPVYRNLYVISAPYSGGHILPAALRVFVEKVGPVFDTIVLDTAAGMGVPFEAAMGVAHRALLVLTPDPVSIRDGRIVCDALEAGGCPGNTSYHQQGAAHAGKLRHTKPGRMHRHRGRTAHRGGAVQHRNTKSGRDRRAAGSGGQAPSGAARHCRTPVRTIYAARDSINMRRMPK